MPPLKTHLGKWRSIEFELIFKKKDYLDQFRSFITAKKYNKFVNIKDDGSIRTNEKCIKCNAGQYHNLCEPREHRTAEICVSFRIGKDKIIYDVCNFFKDKAYVNDSCGTHVHFDMRHVDEAMAQFFGTKLVLAVPALRKLLPKWRRNSDYCEKNVCSTEDDFSSKEAFVNCYAYQEHETIEVRGHAGTLDANKILSWIELCDKIMFSKQVASVKSTKDLKKKYRLNKKLANYVTKRAVEVSREAFIET